MEMKINVPFVCPANIEPYLQKVFDGEYDIGVHLPMGAHVVDIGANYGSFAIWAAHRWPGCTVSAYEPHPQVFSALKFNTAMYEQIEVNNWGIGDEGIRILNDGPNNDGERSFHGILNSKNPTGIHCEVRNPLTLPECDLIKLDIEGCEMEVLKPYIEAGKRPALILLEFHNHKLRREIDSLLIDYDLIGGGVTSALGLGVAKYLRHDLMKGIMNDIIR